jgi:hypothetical protein
MGDVKVSATSKYSKDSQKEDKLDFLNRCIVQIDNSNAGYSVNCSKPNREVNLRVPRDWPLRPDINPMRYPDHELLFERFTLPHLYLTFAIRCS